MVILRASNQLIQALNLIEKIGWIYNINQNLNLETKTLVFLYQNNMGKRKLERIELISNPNTRKVTFCKRKKGLLKKSMELSILCDLNMFILIYDKA